MKTEKINYGFATVDELNKEYPLFSCNLPVKAMMFNDKTLIDNWRKFKLTNKSLLIGLLYGWYNQRQINFKASYFYDLETFALWLPSASAKLQYHKDIRVGWIGDQNYIKELLSMIVDIKNNIKKSGQYLTYEFPSLCHLAHFSYTACRVLGMGYTFRELEKELPISFDVYKYIQMVSKVMYNSAAEMEHAFKQEMEKEMSRWVDN